MKRDWKLNCFLRAVAVALLVTISAGAGAQTEITCADKLKQAQQQFERGQTGKIDSLLKDCLKAGFKKEEELSAYKLIIQTFILDDKVEKADSAMLSFLRKNPEYQLSTTDHSSFVYLYNSYRVRSVLMLGLRFGMNLSFLSFVTENPAFGENTSTAFSSAGAGLWFAAEAKVKVSEKIEAGVEGAFSQLKFSAITENVYGFTNYEESQQRIEVPLFITYTFASSPKLSVYARLGSGPAFLMSSNAKASEVVKERNNPNTRTGEERSRIDSRIKTDLFVQGGLGVRYKIPRGYVSVEARATGGMLNQRYGIGQSAADMKSYYHWSDPKTFNLNSVNFNFGYTYIFYKPSKAK